MIKVNHRLIFLGTAAALQLPSFHCQCRVCEHARNNPKERKTRASIVIIGNKTIVIDAGPDIAFQLEREGIKKVDAILITHWHYDHVGGISEFGQPASIEQWDKIKLFIPEQDIIHFENELSYLKRVFEINCIKPGLKININSISFEVVRTTHSHDSVGYIIEGKKTYAYLVDGIKPPKATVERLRHVDCLILEATVDELDEKWMDFDLKGAIDFWTELGTKECILTHMSFHSWKNKKLIEGFSKEKRKEIEKMNIGLTIAYDGMRVDL